MNKNCELIESINQKQIREVIDLLDENKYHDMAADVNY